MHTEKGAKSSLAPICLGVSCLSLYFMGAVVQCTPLLTDPAGTRRALKAHGYEDFIVLGGTWFGESGEFWRTRFRALDAKGNLVQGYATNEAFPLMSATVLKFDTPAEIRIPLITNLVLKFN